MALLLSKFRTERLEYRTWQCIHYRYFIIVYFNLRDLIQSAIPRPTSPQPPPPIFDDGDNFSNFLFTTLHIMPHFEKGSTLKGTNLLPLFGTNSFQLEWTPFQKGVKLTDRDSSPESVWISVPNFRRHLSSAFFFFFFFFKLSLKKTFMSKVERLNSNSVDPDETAHMSRLIWIYAVYKSLLLSPMAVKELNIFISIKLHAAAYFYLNKWNLNESQITYYITPAHEVYGFRYSVRSNVRSCLCICQSLRKLTCLF